MRNRVWVFFGVLSLMVGTAMAQDARSVLQAASTAMGAANLRSVQYSGTGWNGALGQAYSPDDDWPRFEVFSYTRTIDYEGRSLREELARRQGTYPPRGGGGTPIQGEQRQNLLLSGNYAWAMQGNEANPQPAQAEMRQLEIFLTPHGFLKGAMTGEARAFSIPLGGRNVTIVSFTALGKYRVNGTINDQNLVERVQTWVPHPLLGDTIHQTNYTEYKDFSGIKFPTRIHQHYGDTHQTNPGHHTLDITVSSVQPNISVPAITVPDNVRQARVQPVTVTPQRIADGVWYLLSGNQSSMLVEFNDFAVVVEAPGNEERSLAAIAEVKKLLPNKPIRFLVNTHHHFDHSGGLRTFVAEGSTIVTHERNREYFERVLFSRAPRALEPDRLAVYPRNPTFETVRQKYVISDGVRSLEVHFVNDLDHNENMLMVYLPKEKVLFQGDLWNPPAPNAQGPQTAGASQRVFYRNVQRLKLDVATVVPVHGGRTGAWADFMRVQGLTQ